MAIRELKGNSEINIKKADTGTTTVIMNKQDKIREGQEQLDNRTHYLLLDIPMADRDSVKCRCGRRMRTADGGRRTADGGRTRIERQKNKKNRKTKNKKKIY